MASAQLVNGSFEEGLNGWLWLPADLSSEAMVAYESAPGQGTQCLSVNTVHFMANTPNRVIQILPIVEPGAIVYLSGWMKCPLGYDTPPAFSLEIRDSTGLVTTTGPRLSFASQLGSWQFSEATIALSSLPSPGSSYRLVLEGGLHQAWFQVPMLFDGFSVTFDPNTYVDHFSEKPPAFRPNPAIDKLWIDLPDLPLAITAMDASGRELALRTFHHKAGTLEVDVSSIPTGPCVLLLRSDTGVRTVRFIKA